MVIVRGQKAATLSRNSEAWLDVRDYLAVFVSAPGKAQKVSDVSEIQDVYTRARLDSSSAILGFLRCLDPRGSERTSPMCSKST